MGQRIDVDDPADPRLDDFTALTDVALRRRREPVEGLFVAEGALVIERAMRSGHRLRSVLVGGAELDRVTSLVADDPAPVYVAAPDVLQAVAGFHVHRGALASFHRPPARSPGDLLATASRLAVLENVTNPTNLGAIARSAAGLGIGGLLLDPTCADPLYRRSVRVSMGEVLTLPHARLSPWPAGLDQVRRAGFRLLALTPDPAAVPLDALDAAREPRVALLLGSEGHGLSARTMAAVDTAVRIPMSRGVDSLNVVAAAAVAFWALRREETDRYDGKRPGAAQP